MPSKLKLRNGIFSNYSHGAMPAGPSKVWHFRRVLSSVSYENFLSGCYESAAVDLNILNELSAEVRT